MKIMTLIKSTLSLAFTMFALSMPLRAEEKQSNPNAMSLKTHNIGAGAGFLTGYGLTYRHWSPSKFGYQATLIPVIRINEDETFFNSSSGLIGLRSFHQTQMTNFFGYLGGHYNYLYERDRRYNYIPVSNTSVAYDYKEFTHNLFTGGGIGIEIHFWNLNYSLMTGYAGHLSSTKIIDNSIDYNGLPAYKDSGKWKTSFELQPSIESALFYSF
jgi:hypothetical protein